MSPQISHVPGAESPPGHVSESMASQFEPIVVNGEVEAQAQAPLAKVSYMSLPNKGQLALMCIARMADPLAATSIQVRICQDLVRVCKELWFTLGILDIHVLSTEIL